ncbi:MAG: hypothetical protein LBI17_02635 [Rickettsiales bacterium]|jgi:hypothetical protein|nr:hypothetical protein [Rickettsiales bacterium]
MNRPAKTYIDDLPEENVVLGILERIYRINDGLARMGIPKKLEPAIGEIYSLDDAVTVHNNLDAYIAALSLKTGLPIRKICDAHINYARE